MKGTKDLPACGFSAVIANIFKQFNVPFHDENVLLCDEIRSGIKAFTNWPTIPQIYIKIDFRH